MMRHPVKTILLLAVLLLTLTACVTQTASLDPQSIDPYTFVPRVAEDYSSQAYTAYSEGQYEDAARWYLAHLQNHPDDSTAWYNLACCFGLLNRPDLAAKYLQESYLTGFRDLEHIKADTDFELVRQSPDFTAAMDSLQVWSERRAFYTGEMKYLPARSLLPYYLHLPKNFDPAKTYPLLIGLHGYGDKAANFTQLWRYIEEEEVIFAIPEAPYPFTEGEIGFSWNPFVPDDSYETARSYSFLEEYVTDLYEELADNYNLDRTWLLGFSQGAYNGYLLALKNPWLFDGLIACGGGLLTEMLSEDDFQQAKDLKIIISHGTQDKVIPFESALAAQLVLGEKGYTDVRLDEFEGGHRVSPSAFDAWLEWLGE